MPAWKFFSSTFNKASDAFPCLLLAIFFLFTANSSRATISPANGAVLNYSQLMFEYDEIGGADQYNLVIFEQDQPGKEFKRFQNTTLALLVKDFAFGKNYTWYYEAIKNNKIIFHSEEYHFATRYSYLVDSTQFRSRVEISAPGKFEDGIIFLDYRGIAIDREGHPVWFYPYAGSDLQMDPNFRNLRMTANNDILYINDSNCFEIDLAGKEIWKTPNDGAVSGDGKEYYHHDFMKMPDGSYLTASFKYAYGPNYYNPSLNCRVRYNTLIQYDASGKVIWSWNEKDHVPQRVIFGIYTASDTDIAGTHMNAFDFNEEENCIVMGFRHNSSIARIDKKTGDLAYIIGPYTGLGIPPGAPLFLHQHGMAILPGRELLIYNNNVGDEKEKTISYPTIAKIKEPNGNKPAEKVWEFACTSPRYPQGIMGKGGYAAPLANGNVLACMGGANYSFEITPAKEVVWQSAFEKYNSSNDTWSPFINYRCSFSSSLFPHYFTLQHGQEINNKPVFIINNEGTESDAYLVELWSADGKKKIFRQEITLNKRSSRTISLKIKRADLHDGANAIVTAVSNPGVSKIISFPAIQ